MHLRRGSRFGPTMLFPPKRFLSRPIAAGTSNSTTPKAPPPPPTHHPHTPTPRPAIARLRRPRRYLCIWRSTIGRPVHMVGDICFRAQCLRIPRAMRLSAISKFRIRRRRRAPQFPAGRKRRDCCDGFRLRFQDLPIDAAPIKNSRSFPVAKNFFERLNIHGYRDIPHIHPCVVCFNHRSSNHGRHPPF